MCVKITFHIFVVCHSFILLFTLTNWLLTIIITYTNTGVKSSAAVDPRSCANDNRFIMLVAQRTIQLTLSRGVLYAAMAFSACCAGNHGHSNWNSLWIIRSLWFGVTTRDSFCMCSLNTLKELVSCWKMWFLNDGNYLPVSVTISIPVWI